jgi:hypothetical protein
MWHQNNSCQERSQGLDNHRPQETLGVLKWTQTGKGTHTEALCQEKKKVADKLEQRPAMMGGRTIHRTLKPKRTAFQTESGKQLQGQKMPRETGNSLSKAVT